MDGGIVKSSVPELVKAVEIELELEGGNTLYDGFQSCTISNYGSRENPAVHADQMRPPRQPPLHNVRVTQLVQVEQVSTPVPAVVLYYIVVFGIVVGNVVGIAFSVVHLLAVKFAR